MRHRHLDLPSIMRDVRARDPDPYPFAGGEGDGLAVVGEDGTPGWTATYFVGDRQSRAAPSR